MEHNQIIHNFMGRDNMYRIKVIREAGEPEIIDSLEYPKEKFNKDDLACSKQVNFSSRLSKVPVYDYHSWDLIMPVVEKIERIDNRIEVNISLTSTLITMYDKKGNCLYSRSNINETTKIIHCYNAVVEFIKWYNKQGRNHE